jgi:hypothetical protein
MIQISEREFTSHNIYPNPFGQIFATERAWFKHEGRLGIVLLDNTDKDWSFVALMKDQVGVFRAFDVGVSFPSEAAAANALAQCLLHENAQL